MNNRFFEQQKARQDAEAKAREQVRQNEAARAMAQVRNGGGKTSYLNISTNQSPSNYKYAVEQSLRQNGHKK